MVVVLQLIRGDDVGGRRVDGLSAEQLAGEHCVICDRPEAEGIALRRVAWYADGEIRAHTWHFEAWRMGEFQPPARKV